MQRVRCERARQRPPRTERDAARAAWNRMGVARMCRTHNANSVSDARTLAQAQTTANKDGTLLHQFIPYDMFVTQCAAQRGTRTIRTRNEMFEETDSTVIFVCNVVITAENLTGLHASVARHVCFSTFVVGISASHSTPCLHELPSAGVSRHKRADGGGAAFGACSGR